MRSRQVACLGSCVYLLPCTLTYTSRFTPDMLVCWRVLGTAVLWGRPWGWGARAAGARAPGRPPGPRGPALVWGAGRLPRRARPGRARAATSWGLWRAALPRACLPLTIAAVWGRTHHLVFDKCQPGVYYPHGDIITPSWILRDSPVGIMERKLMSLYDPHT